MKKIDKLVLKSFWGPFVLTLCVVVFIFLMRLMMFYIDQFVSKDVEFAVFGKIIFYFSLITIPIALPLAILLSSLMTYGNLGEFFELTALKSAGISLTRAMRPLLIVATGIAIFSFWFNNKVAPWANLKGYSLLWDIKSSKATLSIKEGIFYNDLPGYSIKADKKDGETLRGLVIYKHQENGLETGNREIILADSGRMFTTSDKQYLIFELYNGNDYTEYTDNSSNVSYASNGSQNSLGKFMRNGFEHYKLRISLESFGLKRTDEQQFEYHEYMKNLSELATLTDSLKQELKTSLANTANTSRQYYSYQFKQPVVSAVTSGTASVPSSGTAAVTAPATPTAVRAGKWIDSLLARPVDARYQGEIQDMALSQARNMLSYAESNQTYLKEKAKTVNRYELESHHKFTQAISCFIMFLIGAPLGAIIKKGGFGVPVLVSILFFILLYVLTLTGDKYAKDGLIWVPAGAWMANVILLPIGLYLMKQARNDSRLFDKDVYIIWWGRMKKRYVDWRTGRIQAKMA
ncbi:LptF/LptG family permease [Larkinella insperata]|uniref:LptF/LptG family permease n=1 Tax=Larkinella insperata TaxID=332158 RepID=A0ABW3Q567_9BACT|nr:LptF/LptG family permease [Larkinella insperata]